MFISAAAYLTWIILAVAVVVIVAFFRRDASLLLCLIPVVSIVVYAVGSVYWNDWKEKRTPGKPKPAAGHKLMY